MLFRSGTAFVGVEYNRRRVLKMARRLARQTFRNIRLVEAKGQEVVCDLPLNSVSEFWVNFSDPWPKKRHAKNRILQAEMIHAMARSEERRVGEEGRARWTGCRQKTKKRKRNL